MKKRDFGEADSFISFFTKDYGRINARAQGVRYLKSKLRYSLFGFSKIRLAFMSSQKGYWRMVDAEEIGIFHDTRNNFEKSACAGRILGLLERLIHGEEPDGGLWENIFLLLDFLENIEPVGKNLKDFEIWAVLRLLVLTGYMEADKDPDFCDISSRRAYWISLINMAIAESQL